jgi:hypothetical protein
VPDNQTDHFGSYSFLWWTNGADREGTRMWPDAPEDTFGAFGHGGPRALVVIPSLDIVVSYNDAELEGWKSGKESPTNRALKLLVAGVRKEARGATLEARGRSARRRVARAGSCRLLRSGQLSQLGCRKTQAGRSESFDV